MYRDDINTRIYQRLSVIMMVMVIFISL